ARTSRRGRTTPYRRQPESRAPDAPHSLTLLRARRERPCRRRAEQGDEIAPFDLTELPPLIPGQGAASSITDRRGSVGIGRGAGFQTGVWQLRVRPRPRVLASYVSFRQEPTHAVQQKDGPDAVRRLGNINTHPRKS